MVLEAPQGDACGANGGAHPQAVGQGMEMGTKAGMQQLPEAWESVAYGAGVMLWGEGPVPVPARQSRAASSTAAGPIQQCSSPSASLSPSA